jgi:glycosyltransferase involved in cell wall biosynthesis
MCVQSLGEMFNRILRAYGPGVVAGERCVGVPDMRILCLDQVAQLGGGQLCLLDLIPAFLANGWEIQAMAPSEGEYAGRLRALGCNVAELRLPPLSSGRKTFTDHFSYVASVVQSTMQIRKQVRGWRPDLLYVNGPRVLPAAARVGRQEGIPLIFHAHHRISEGSALRLVQASLNASRASVIACCSYVAASLTPRIPGSRIGIIYNGVSEHRGLPVRVTSPIRSVGIIGRIDPEKGQLEFIRAARMVAPLFPQVEFQVVGSPQLSTGRYSNRVLKESEGLPVRFHGWQHDISAVLGSLDLLVVSSVCAEATPRVILEALSAGVPVLAFAVGGIPEIIDDSRTGFLSAPTPEALASRMADVLETDLGVIDLISQRGRSTWRERFHIDRWRAHVCDRVTRTALSNQAGFAASEPQLTI